MLASLDQTLLLLLNATLDHPVLSKIVSGIGNVQLVRGFPIFFALVALWFGAGRPGRRGRMLAGMGAVCVALFVSLWLQHAIYVHTRPFLDTALALNVFDPGVTKNWDRINSFPSDTATLFFALAMVIFLEKPIWGAAAFAWTLLTVGCIRVALGYHYPSDILGALVLGPAFVFAAAHAQVLTNLAERLMTFLRGKEAMLHACFFIFIAEAYSSFSSLERAAGAVSVIEKQLTARQVAGNPARP